MKGFGCFAAYAIAVIIVFAVWPSNKNKTVSNSTSQTSISERAATDALARKRAQQQKSMEKESLIRAFALKELPEVWSGLQNLDGQLADCKTRKEKLAEVLTLFDRVPHIDVDYQKIVKRENDIVSTIATIRNTIQNAYLESCKFEAMAGFGDEKAMMADYLARAKEEAMMAEKNTTRCIVILNLKNK